MTSKNVEIIVANSTTNCTNPWKWVNKKPWKSSWPHKNPPVNKWEVPKYIPQHIAKTIRFIWTNAFVVAMCELHRQYDLPHELVGLIHNASSPVTKMCHDCIGIPTRYLIDPTCLSNTRKKYIRYIPRNSSGIDGNTKGAVTSRHNSNLCTIFCHEQLPWAPLSTHLHETIPFRVILLIACVICMYAL